MYTVISEVSRNSPTIASRSFLGSLEIYRGHTHNQHRSLLPFMASRRSFFGVANKEKYPDRQVIQSWLFQNWQMTIRNVTVAYLMLLMHHH